jgi:hypothetical protein
MNARVSRRRALVCGLNAAACTLSVGCNLFRPKPEAPDVAPPKGATVSSTRPSTDEVVRFLNKQADLVQSVDARDITLTFHGAGSSPPSLEGSLMVQKPRYFRLVGKFLGSQEVLAGSNEDRFWFWVKRDPQDVLYHCSYTEFEKGVELPFPFDPSWVLEAMGMAHIPADGVKRLEFDDKTRTVKLVQDATLHGQKVTKVTVCYNVTTRGNVPQVKQRIVYDERGKAICVATVKSVTRVAVGRDPEGQVAYAIVPEVVKLEWPAQDMTLELDLGAVKINGQLPMEAFQMPRVGSRQLDLGRDHPTNRGVIRAAQ